ncbi:MAG TPA: DUF2851 family protein [Bacteroidales bacterium]|nr:DUF2851 family protein [Bacteroidales bacterium]
MTEDFLHFIWKYGLFDRDSMISDTGENVSVTVLGEHNADAGPDFLNARVKIGDTIWAGNVEIHLRSSDWNLHKHKTDKAYDNVVLHVVHHYDQPVARSTNEPVPTVILKFDERLYDNYCSLLNQKKTVLCQDKIRAVDPLIIDVWLNSLVIERLQQKTEYLSSLMMQLKNNWEEVFYINLARSFGFGLNSLPFELMARSLPLTYLLRHRDNALQCEALILGQAGFLEEAVLFSDYYSQLRNEYIHLKKKFNLKPIEKHMWKFLRLRPVNFPTIRLAQFANLIHNTENLFSAFMSCTRVDEICNLLHARASIFWDTHYSFDTLSRKQEKNLGAEAANTIIINALMPFLFIYGKQTGRDEIKERAVTWLMQMPAENNRITGRWEDSGVRASSAFYSQGLIQLSNSYCAKKRCLACSIGIQVVKKG